MDYVESDYISTTPDCIGYATPVTQLGSNHIGKKNEWPSAVILCDEGEFLNPEHPYHERKYVPVANDRESTELLHAEAVGHPADVRRYELGCGHAVSIVASEAAPSFCPICGKAVR